MNYVTIYENEYEDSNNSRPAKHEKYSQKWLGWNRVLKLGNYGGSIH